MRYLKLTYVLNFSFLILFLLIGCKKEVEQKPILQSEIKNSNTYFKGIIKLEEVDFFGKRASVTLTFNGDDVKREVQDYGQKIIYGMIYKRNQDSISYYYQNKEFSYYTVIPKDKFKTWVRDLQKPSFIGLDTKQSRAVLPEPFGTVFSTFGSSNKNSLVKTTKANFKNFGLFNIQTYYLDNGYVCNVWYYENFKIHQEILEAIEHNIPNTLHSLPLKVKYSAPKIESKGTFAEELKEKTNKIFVKIEKNIELKEFAPSENTIVELPSKFKRITVEEMSNLVSPPEDNNNKKDSSLRDLFD